MRTRKKVNNKKKLWIYDYLLSKMLGQKKQWLQKLVEQYNSFSLKKKSIIVYFYHVNLSQFPTSEIKLYNRCEVVKMN